jgi:ComF family protein
MNKLKALILSMVFPKKCPFCKKIIKNNDFLCEICATKLPQKPYVRDINAETMDFLCVSALKNEGDVREAILRYKFRNYKNYAPNFADITAIAAKNYLESKGLSEPFDLITCVPLSAKRLKKRGYNQAQILAKCTGDCLGLKYVETLKKVRDNKQQHSLCAAERRENVRGVYACLNCDIIRGRRVLICDDIVTTGSTLAEASITLKNAGAKSVLCLTFATTL